MPALLIANPRPYAEAVRHLPPLTGDDAELARRIAAAARARDGAAEAELARRFPPRIRFYGLRHLRNEAAAADLVQDVLLMILQKLRAREVREPERLPPVISGPHSAGGGDGGRRGRPGGGRAGGLREAFAAALSPLADDGFEALDAGRLRECLQRLPERE